MSDYATSGGEGGTGMPSGDVGGAPTTSGDVGGQGGAMPAGGQPAGGTSPGQLPAGAGNFDGENLLAISRGIFGEGHESEAQAELEAKQAQPEGETPAQPQPQPAGPDWASLGEFDQVKSNADLAAALLGDDPAQFWTSFQERDADKMIGALDAIIESAPQFFVDALHRSGIWNAPSPAELSVIDQKYHEMYSRLSAQERYEIQAEEDPDAQADLLENHYRNFEHDRMLDDHEKQFETQREQERHERAMRLTDEVRNTVAQGISHEIRADLTQLIGDPALAGEAGVMLFTAAEAIVCRDPANQRQIQLLDRAIASGNKNEAMRLALPLQAKVGKTIRSFLGKFNGAGNPAPDRAQAPRASAAATGAARVDKLMDRALDPAPPANDDLTEGSKQVERLRKMSRSVFG